MTHSPQWVSGTEPLLLVAEDLRKSYGNRTALRGLSFSLKAGHILGFLGPNGAGKTTSIRILTTMMEPTSGSFVVDGTSSKDPEAIRRKIGVLPEGLGFPKRITGFEYLTYFGQLYGRTAPNAKAYALELLKEVGMQERGRSLIDTYSHGMRQRLGIARALVNDPVVIFLDEPTLGLDPRGQQELLSLVRRITQERQIGVVLCSHALSEIEGICDDVVILSSGQVVASGTVAELIGRARQNVKQHNVFRIQVQATMVAEAQQILAVTPHVLKVTPTGEEAGWLQVELADADGGGLEQEHHLNNRLLEALIRANIPILSFAVEGGRLQDVFLNLTAETIS